MPRLGKFLAGFFCVAAVGGSLTIFQVNQAYAQFREVTGFDQAFLFGLIVAVWIGIVLFGGVRRIVKWTDKLSPIHVPAVRRGLHRGARGELRKHSRRRSRPSCARPSCPTPSRAA